MKLAWNVLQSCAVSREWCHLAKPAKPAKRLKLLSIVRLFLSDIRAVERGLSVANRSRPDAIEILPAVAAVKTTGDFQHCPFPRITGGLCRTEGDIREALASGCQAVTSTLARLWELNKA
ncbi:MAG: glycerol-3-phosphate responsive antiterminator [Pirellulales bacterium]